MTVDNQQLYRVLKQRFGFDDFRDGQLETIHSIVAGENVLAVLPTGGGKSLLYQLPAYIINRPVLVVSPLLSLMQDQINRLRLLGEKRLLQLSGELQGRQRTQALSRLANYRFIFASPEILANPVVNRALRQVQWGMMVIDEAHCISQWGPDFRPEYLLLAKIHQQLQQPPLLMITATATPPVRQDIIRKMGLLPANVHQVIRSVNRHNIFLAVERFQNDQDKMARLKELLLHLPLPGVVYFASRKLASQVAEWLRSQTGLAVAAYHAGIPSLERYRLQQQFMKGQVQVICATSAFGMGIDKSNIRVVIHYHLPASLESYVQEIGRAGRDDQPSCAILMVGPGDEQIQVTLTTVDLPSADLLDQVRMKKLSVRTLGDQADLFKFYLDHGYQGQQIVQSFHKRARESHQRLRKMMAYINTDLCRRQQIADYFGEPLHEQVPCCDVDQPSWLQDHLWQDQVNEPISAGEQDQLDWRAHLQSLLLSGNNSGQ